MKNKLFIEESEKNRILEMHREAITKNILNEEPPFTPYSPSNINKTPNVIKEQKVITNINPKNLKINDGGTKKPKLKNDVIALQQKLINFGCLTTDTGKPTGYFGNKTNTALTNYNQKGPCNKETKTVNKNPELNDGFLNQNSSLLFDGDYLYWLSSGKTIKKWNAISGLTIKNALDSKHIGQYLKSFIQNKNQWMKEKDAGPIPTGKYIVGPLETRSGEPSEINAWQAAWYFFTGKVEQNKDFYVNSLESKIGWGNYRLSIKALPGTITYKRAGFYIHGGSLEGSHGCIDLTDEMKNFSKIYAAWSGATNKKTMPLEVKYNDSLFDLITKSLVSLDAGQPVDLAYLEDNNNNNNERYA